jgi:hypothetical protein
VSGDVFSVIGDSRDPAGSALRGRSQGFTLTKTALARPVVRWRDFFLTVDVYDDPGTHELQAHLYCPVCAQRATAGAPKHNALMIRQSHKQIELSFERMPRFHGIDNMELLAKLRAADKLPPLAPGSATWQIAYREAFVSISIAAFGCTWEGEFGLCPWRVEVVDNVARDV